MKLGIKGVIDLGRSRYDRVLAFVAVAGLIFTFVALFVRFGAENRRQVESERWVRNLVPEHEHVDQVTDSSFVMVQRAIANPAQLPVGEERAGWYFVPGSRFSCAHCGHPVPVDAENCPFCEEPVTPPEPETIDHDGDGMPTNWENTYGLNPNDATDKSEDLDKDGFTNFEEYSFGTNPADAKSRPPLIDWLVVDKVESQRFGLQFRSRVRTHTGFRFGINYMLPSGDTKTDFVEIGESVTGFKIEGYEEKWVAAAPPTPGKVDRSELTVRSPKGDLIVLVKDEPVKHVELTAYLRVDREGVTLAFATQSDETFTFDGAQYRVIEIDAQNRNVIVRGLPDGSRYTITSVARPPEIIREAETEEDVLPRQPESQPVKDTKAAGSDFFDR